MDNIYSLIETMPQRVKNVFLSIDKDKLEAIEEIRIRLKAPMIVYIRQTPYFLTCINGKTILSKRRTNFCFTADEETFHLIVNKLCNNSYHTKMATMINGYITTENGSRIGVASTASYNGGKIESIRDITSLNIRISREIKGIADGIIDKIYRDNTPSVIIAAPPGAGKTTLLRDIARALSKEKYHKTIIVDERDEIASGFDVGFNTDVLRNFRKTDGIEIAVRTLSPDVIICDEIGSIEEADKVISAFYSGVKFAVSVHLDSVKNIKSNAVLRRLTDSKFFDYLIFINENFRYEIYSLRNKNENSRRIVDNMLYDLDIADFY